MSGTMDATNVLELAREVAVETSPTDSVGLLARMLARKVLDQEAQLAKHRAMDLTREEAEALRGCSVHCSDGDQLKRATQAIDKAVSGVFKCLRCWDAGVLKYVTSGGEPYAALFCDCSAGEVRRQ